METEKRSGQREAGEMVHSGTIGEELTFDEIAEMKGKKIIISEGPPGDTVYRVAEVKDVWPSEFTLFGRCLVCVVGTKDLKMEKLFLEVEFDKKRQRYAKRAYRFADEKGDMEE